LATVAPVQVAGTSADWFAPLFFAIALTSGITTAVAAGVYARRENLTGRELVADLTRVWREPTGGWVLFLFGWLVTLPLYGLHTTVIHADSDSARLLASMLYVQRNGPEYLVETQENLLPHLVMAPAVALGGIPAAMLVSIVSLQALAGVVAFLAWRLNHSIIAPLGSLLGLMTFTAIVERAFLLPMYPLMLALGFLGVYLARRTIAANAPRGRWAYAVAAGLCLLASIEAHQVGQLFLALTAFLVVTATPAVALRRLAQVYLAFAVVFLPRAVINLMDGGLSYFFSNRVDFWVTKDYLVPIQVEFWDLARTDYTEWFSRAPEGALNVMGWGGLLTAALGIAALGVWRGRLRWFALAFAVFFAAVALFLRLPFYPRYHSVLLVGACLGAGTTLAFLLRRPSPLSRRLAVLGAALLALFGAFGYYAKLDEARDRQEWILSGPYKRLAARIPAGERIIGTRSIYLNFTTTDPRAYGEQFLTEEEYVAFLTWPSDEAVIAIMRQHDIGWVFVPRRAEYWVGAYHNIWLRPAHGKVARYHLEVGISPSFCLVKRIRGVQLYRLNLEGPLLRRCRAGASSE
jgi:hypothetical protein